MPTYTITIFRTVVVSVNSVNFLRAWLTVRFISAILHELDSKLTVSENESKFQIFGPPRLDQEIQILSVDKTNPEANTVS